MTPIPHYSHHTPSPPDLPVSFKITRGAEEHGQGHWLHLTNGILRAAVYLQPGNGIAIRLLEQAAEEAQSQEAAG